MNSSAETRHAATLEEHLKRENPLLLEPLAEFRKLDRVARGLGLLAPDDSFTRRVPWWPVISLLGTFSAGKSTFINGYLGLELQRTGNQAVDDRFTVICYGEEEEPRTLPGSALDADPRFPFYRISGDIDEVAAGEGQVAVLKLLLAEGCPRGAAGACTAAAGGEHLDCLRWLHAHGFPWLRAPIPPRPARGKWQNGNWPY